MAAVYRAKLELVKQKYKNQAILSIGRLVILLPTIFITYVELVYLVEGNIQNKHTTFKDVYTKQKEEFLLLNDGEIIRLDHIVSVDGIE
ncbi:MAG: hypothetical protein AB8B65_12400 [Kordia sp.]|uniref:hypothetical protein n=1 Tax=Kordia sp. TaxID=1965332 RepID=UPI00385F9ED6